MLFNISYFGYKINYENNIATLTPVTSNVGTVLCQEQKNGKGYFTGQVYLSNIHTVSLKSVNLVVKAKFLLVECCSLVLDGLDVADSILLLLKKAFKFSSFFFQLVLENAGSNV